MASADTVSDIQAQISNLQTQLQSLETQLKAAIAVSVPSVATSTSSVNVHIVSSACPTISRSLSIGISGADVTGLQQFLSAHGFLNASSTGYFGALTQAAVGAWQAESGIAVAGNAGFGIFGPLSRAHFFNMCGSASTGSSTATSTSSLSFSASPQSGAAPLTVTFTMSAPQGSQMGSTVNFGDGTMGTLAFVPTCSSCNAMATVSHTYAAAGTYTASLTSGGACACPANGICNCPMIALLATTTVTVATTSASSAGSDVQINAPANVTLSPGGVAEVRNEGYYFTLESLTSSSATIQTTPVGCWNSFPSDPKPQIICMIAMLPVPPQTISLGQAYASGKYAITLTGLGSGTATFSVGAPATN